MHHEGRAAVRSNFRRNSPFFAGIMDRKMDQSPSLARRRSETSPAVKRWAASVQRFVQVGRKN